MSDDGTNIIKMMEQIGTICEQSSLLLKTADKHMEKKGWEAYSNTVINDMSKSLNEPKKWFPNYLFRFYLHDEYENILAFISILLVDDLYGNYEGKLTEPLITAGIFDYGEGNEVDEWEYWYAKWYKFHEESDNNYGTIFESKANWIKEWEEKLDYKFDFQSYKCFGYPLISITNEDYVVSRIVNQLLDLILT